MTSISSFFYFLACLFGRQFLYPRETISPTVEFNATNATIAVAGPYANHSPYMYVPFFTLFEFISFVGWRKVADELLNPFGDDDEDFKINYLIDRNLQVSYLIVDEAMHELELFKDPFLDNAENDIPHTALLYPNEDSDKGTKCTKNPLFTDLFLQKNFSTYIYRKNRLLLF